MPAEVNGAFADDSPAASRRIARLIDGRPAVAWPARLLAVASGVALVAVPTVLLLSPGLG
jgi:hypothetical protein